MAYRYEFADLIDQLRPYAPAKAQMVYSNRHKSEHGLPPVGLKIHCLDDGRQFDHLVEGLGGRELILEINYYKRENASLCLVLPPVGSRTTAIQLLECIETATDSHIINNPAIQIQVCSPGRLLPLHANILSIIFYLGSDVLRRYTLNQLETTFSEFSSKHDLERGRRLVLYDANGTFETDFEWWIRDGEQLLIYPELPIRGRTDILTATSRWDIGNINLVAGLLLAAEHVEEGAWWGKLGQSFIRDVTELLDDHLLSGLLDAPWIRSDDNVIAGDTRFDSALQELTAYVFDEVLRANKAGKYFWPTARKKPAMSILSDMRQILKMYRSLVIKESLRLQGGNQT